MQTFAVTFAVTFAKFIKINDQFFNIYSLKINANNIYL